MALKKQTTAKDTHTLVTFTIAKNEAPSSSNVLLLGDFNNWKSNDSAWQMEKKGSSYVKSVELKNGKRYEFRYLSVDKGWFNDHAADDYVPSPYESIDNSVVDLKKAASAKKAPVKKAAVKKAPAKKAPVKKAVVKKAPTKKAAVKKVAPKTVSKTKKG